MPRVQHISESAAEADNQHLGLFTKEETLTRNDKRNINNAFDATLNLRRQRNDNGTVLVVENDVMKIRGTGITRSDFWRLRDSLWFNDTLIYTAS